MRKHAPDRSSTIQNPSNRQFIFDIGKLGSSRHYVRGLVEVDVTEALGKIKEIRTIAVDLDIMDGIPAARFCDDLVKRLETGFGFD